MKNMRPLFTDKSELRYTAVALVILVLIIYSQTASFDFLRTWDDKELLLDNRYIKQLTVENLKDIFSEPVLGTYAPVHMLGYAFQYQLWGGHAFGYHLVNVLLHALNSLLLFFLIRNVTQKPHIAMAATLLFAVHPVNVEVVAWIAQSKTLLATFFFLASMLLYIRFRQRQTSWAYYTSIGCFVLSVFSKTVTVVLPLALLIYELFILEKQRRVRYLAAFFIIAAAGAGVTFFTFSDVEILNTRTMSMHYLFRGVYPTSAPVTWKYILLLVLPVKLNGYYNTTLYSSLLQAVPLISLTAWAAVFALVMVKGKRQVRFWFLWFWITFLPVSNIIPLTFFYADRYMYLPGIGLFVLFFLLLDVLLVKLRVRRAAEGPRPRRAFYITLCAVLVLMASLSHDRAGVWKNDLVFWEDVVKKSPKMYKPRINLGAAYEARNMLKHAEREYLNAISINPRKSKAQMNLRVVRSKMAIQQKREAP